MSRLDAMDWAGMFDAPGPASAIEGPLDGEPTKPYEPTPEEKERIRKRSELRGAQSASDRFDNDDRRWCTDCERLNTDTGRCSAPAAGLLIASRNYQPALTMPRRCIAYRPCCCDPIKTPGAVRWPWLKDAV